LDTSILPAGDRPCGATRRIGGTAHTSRLPRESIGQVFIEVSRCG